MIFASQQPLKDSERPRERTLGEALESLRQGVVRRQARAFYDRPIPTHAKVLMHRMLGEAED